MSWGSSGVEQWIVAPLVSGSIPFPEIFGYIFTKIKCNHTRDNSSAGEHHTEDVEVPGSTPGYPILFCRISSVW